LFAITYCLTMEWTDC